MNLTGRETQLVELAQALRQKLGLGSRVWEFEPNRGVITWLPYVGHAYIPGDEGRPIGTFAIQMAWGNLAERAHVYENRLDVRDNLGTFKTEPWRSMLIDTILKHATAEE